MAQPLPFSRSGCEHKRLGSDQTFKPQGGSPGCHSSWMAAK
jgi:hypothetical protein